jgi:hypothetical protein
MHSKIANGAESADSYSGSISFDGNLARSRLSDQSSRTHHQSILFNTGTRLEPLERLEINRPGSFSSCLLVMDDNHFLTEWLAYHYHVLPLRRLIIAVDPRSVTTPAPILNRWRSPNLNFNISLWADHDFMADTEEHRVAVDWVRRKFENTKIGEDLIQHRARQRLFYYKCMKQLKNENRDWTILTDSDEYLLINYETVKTTKTGLVTPSVDEPGSVLTFLQRELAQPMTNLTSPCIQIPRSRFNAQESESSQVQKLVPLGLNASQFQTLRWRHHADAYNYAANRISKVVMDLSRVPWSALEPVSSIHRPVRSLCGRRKLHLRAPEQVFVIHHYLGTWAQYSYRDDSRKGNERGLLAYQKAQQFVDKVETDDDIRPWLDGFARRTGVEIATALLAGVGVIDP